MWFVLASLATLLFFGLVVLYLRAAYDLIAHVRAEHPVFWREALGAPEFEARTRQTGLDYRVHFHLVPLLPFLRWLVTDTASALGAETERRHRRTRRRLLATALGFLGVLRVFLRSHFGW